MTQASNATVEFDIIMDSQRPSPNLKKTLCNFEPQIWLEMITSRDAKNVCSNGSRMSCHVIISVSGGAEQDWIT